MKRLSFGIIALVIIAVVLLLSMPYVAYRYEIYKIASGAMMPTLLVGDYVFVDRFAYGLPAPFSRQALAQWREPVRGDLVVFRYPQDKSIDFVFRIVAVPGDKVEIRAGELFINGETPRLEDVTFTAGAHPDNPCWRQATAQGESVAGGRFVPYPWYDEADGYAVKVETLPGGEPHLIQFSASQRMKSDGEWILKKDEYFGLGDNRDQSQDSRFWGVIPRENLIGRAEFIWLSNNFESGACRTQSLIRWDRFGRRIH